MFSESENNIDNDPKSGGILDAVIESEHAHALADFRPDILVAELLKYLKDRERLIVSLRYGLSGEEQQTLESIGKKMNLTRERVRQVEKESLKSLRRQRNLDSIYSSLDLVRKTIDDHGRIFAQHALIDHLLLSDKSTKSTNALLFLLELDDNFLFLPESDLYHPSWHIKEFEIEKLDSFHHAVRMILESAGAPVDLAKLKEYFQSTDSYKEYPEYFNDRVIENMLQVTKHVKSNPFGEYGLHSWRVIQPRDVGDKAYLVLKHSREPMHYTKITEQINQHHFDDRTAYKETVHNELIMDPRFVLVGRGIYALSEWGYKKGLVSDVISEILAKSSEPMERNKIVEEVLKHRMVRRNTILVGLANKKLFKKIGKSKYVLA